MNKALTLFLDSNMKKNFANAGLTNARIEVKLIKVGDDARKSEQAVLVYNDAEGKPVEKILGTTKSGTLMEQLATYTADAINTINTAANKSKGSGGQTFIPTYPVWLVDNPGKTFENWKKEFGL